MTLPPKHRVFDHAARILCHRSKRGERWFLWLQAKLGADVLTPSDTDSGLERQAAELDERLGGQR